MSSANVTVSGRLSRDAESTNTKNGSLMVTLNVPVKQGWGENESTAWYRIRVSGKRADTLANLELKKGTKVTASGTLEAKTYQANDGSTKLDLGFFANEVDIDFDRKTDQQSESTPQTYEEYPQF